MEDVSQMLNNYQQTGDVNNNPIVPPVRRQAATPPTARTLKPVTVSPAEQELLQIANETGSRSYTDEAVEAGWGQSKYDTETGFQPDRNIEDVRARAQSGLSKIVNGTIKGGITAVSTFTDTVFGTLYGVGSSLFELAGQVSGLNGRSFDMDKVVDAGVNNWVSEQTVKLMDWAEGVFPNYRTEEEQSEEYQREWYKHIGTPNFIGDSIIKNFGFTVGAMGGGLVATKGIGALKSRKLSFDLMKGVAAASEGDNIAANAIKSSIGVDTKTLEKNIAQASQQLNRYGAQMQLYGAVIGALGEGTMEGLMAKNEFLEDYLPKLEKQYAQDYENVESEVLNSPASNGWYTEVPMLDENMRVVNRKYLTAAGEEEVERRRNMLALDLDKAKEFANAQGERLATNTFLLNIPILTASNTIQFGRMFSGGWKTARSGAAKVAGNVRAGKIGAGPAKYSVPTITSTVQATGRILPKTVLYSLKNAGSEAFEEMAQGFISSGSKNVAAKRLTAFNDDGYDPETVESFGNWIAQMVEGGTDYLGDIKNWQEGFLGALTGLLGIPGKPWNGGIAEARRQAKSDVADSQEAADALNALVSTQDFQNRWHGYIRHLLYDKTMADALAADDQFTWQNENNKQLINDIVTFADAGRLDDLMQVVDVFGNMTADEARNFKNEMSSSVDGEDNWTKNLSPQEIASKVGEQAKNMKTAIEQYNTMYRELSSIAPTSASPEMIKEMVFTSMYLRDKEQRFQELNNEVMDGIKPYLRTIVEESEEASKKAINDKEIERRANNLKSWLESYVSSPLPMKYSDEMEAIINAHLTAIAAEAESNPELSRKISDLKRLAKERRDYYKKFEWLMETTPEEFDEKAITPDKVQAEAEKTYVAQKFEQYKTLDDVKKDYFSKDAKGRAELQSMFDANPDGNQNVKNFIQIKKRFDDFTKWLNNHPVSSDDITVTPVMIQGAVNDILKRAKSEDDVKTLPDSVFIPRDQFNVNFQSPFGPASATAYDSVKNTLRAAMNAYLGVESATQSKDTLSSTPVTPEPTPTATPTGYDASQPGSLGPAPNPQSKPKPKPAEKTVETTPVVKKPTEEQLVYDAKDAETDNIYFGVGKERLIGSDKEYIIPFLRTSYPEISTNQMLKVIYGIIERKDADFSNFLDYLEHTKDEDLSEADRKIKYDKDARNSIIALQQRGAFDAVATQAEVGDEVEFVIDPTFPMYNDQYQILVRQKKSGQVLTVLSGQSSKYYGLSELRKAIDDEYQKFRVMNPNGVFTFSKTSKIWAKRAGFIDYDFSGKEEKNIVDIPSYDKDAPVVFIDRNGDAVLARGNDSDVVNKVSDSFNDSNANRERGKVGNLYYLVKSDKDRYIPIRLNVEHFKPENKDADNQVFGKIRGYINNISEITRQTDSSNLAEQNEKLYKAVGNLVGYLDLSGISFKLGDYENDGVALRINYGTDSIVRRQDQITDEWLQDLLAGYGRSVQIRKNSKGDVQNFSEYIDSGVITSNARMLRPKGMDIYFNAWMPDKKEFGPITAAQANIQEGITNEDVMPAPDEKPDIPETEFGDTDEFGMDDDSGTAYGEKPVEKRKGENTDEAEGQNEFTVPESQQKYLEMLDKKYSELDSETQEYIKLKGYSEKEFDELPDMLKEKVLKCL